MTGQRSRAEGYAKLFLSAVLHGALQLLVDPREYAGFLKPTCRGIKHHIEQLCAIDERLQIR